FLFFRYIKRLISKKGEIPMTKYDENKMIIWSLFDSGNGSYFNALKDMDNIENFSIGLDIENKNDHFINVDSSDYSFLFGKDELINKLSELPKPDLIIARDRKSTRLNSSHVSISYAVFCLKKK